MTLYSSTPRDDLPVLPNFAQLSEGVWRVMGLNPGKFTLQGTNTYIVGKGNRKVLIDCGDGQPGYVPLLIDSLASIDPEAYISDILISHCHKDHWGGLDDIMNSPLNKKQDHSIKVHKFPLMEETTPYKHLESFPQTVEVQELQDDQIFEVEEDCHIRIVHTPGHAKDHCAFYLEEANIVFTADCILGHGSVSFEDLTEYVCGLHKIQDLNPSKLYPGHGEVVNNGKEKVDQYLAIRIAKENQILSIMRKSPSKDWTAIELVEEMKSVSKGFNEDLMVIVVRTIGLHLIKLYFDQKVELLDAEKFYQKQGLDPYDAINVYSIVNQKWRLLDQNSKL